MQQNFKFKNDSNFDQSILLNGIKAVDSKIEYPDYRGRIPQRALLESLITFCENFI